MTNVSISEYRPKTWSLHLYTVYSSTNMQHTYTYTNNMHIYIYKCTNNVQIKHLELNVKSVGLVVFNL